MTDTDVFNFNSLKVFDSIKDNLIEGAREICDVFEDLLFVWNRNNLQVVNWRSAQYKNVKDVKYQVKHSFLIYTNNKATHFLFRHFVRHLYPILWSQKFRYLMEEHLYL